MRDTFKRDEENCPATAIFIPTPVLSGSGSKGMISVFYNIDTPKDFNRKSTQLFLLALLKNVKTYMLLQKSVTFVIK